MFPLIKLSRLVFLQLGHVKHLTGIPYGPQDQATVERAHLSLKAQVQKQKGVQPLPQALVDLATFTLFFKSTFREQTYSNRVPLSGG